VINDLDVCPWFLPVTITSFLGIIYGLDTCHIFIFCRHICP